MIYAEQTEIRGPHGQVVPDVWVPVMAPCRRIFPSGMSAFALPYITISGLQHLTAVGWGDFNYAEDPVTWCEGTLNNAGEACTGFVRLVERLTSTVIGYVEYPLSEGGSSPFAVTAKGIGWMYLPYYMRLDYGHIEGEDKVIDGSASFTTRIYTQTWFHLYFTDSFEETLDGWDISGSAVKSSEHALTGLACLKMGPGDVAIAEVVDDVGGSDLQGVIFMANFYDDLGEATEGLGGIENANSTKSILAGIKRSESTTHYVVSVNGAYTVTSVERSAGWHQIWILVNETQQFVWIDDPSWTAKYTVNYDEGVSRLALRGGPLWWDDVRLLLQLWDCGNCTSKTTTSSMLAPDTPLELQKEVPYSWSHGAKGIRFGSKTVPYAPATLEASVDEYCEHGYPYGPASWVPDLPQSMSCSPEDMSGGTAPWYVMPTVAYDIVAPWDASDGSFCLHLANQVGPLMVVVYKRLTVGGALGLGVGLIQTFQSLQSQYVGRSGQLCGANVKNNSVFADVLWARVMDRGTQEVVFSQSNSYAPGAERSLAVLLTMPAKTWNLRFAVGHFDGGDPSQPITDDYEDFTIELLDAVTPVPRVDLEEGHGEGDWTANPVSRLGTSDEVEADEVPTPGIGVANSFWKSLRLAFDQGISNVRVFQDGAPDLGSGAIMVGVKDSGDAGATVYSQAKGEDGKYGYPIQHTTQGHPEYRTQVVPRSDLSAYTRESPLVLDSTDYAVGGESKQLVLQAVVGRESLLATQDVHVRLMWDES